MTSSYETRAIEPDDAKSGFKSGQHPLDDFLKRHALRNDRDGIGRTYVLVRSSEDDPALPALIGFYTLSMANVSAESVAPLLTERLPRYPMPVALIGRLAIDSRAQRRGFGERLLIDALRRVVDAARLIGCLGVIADAKDERAERFYAAYDFQAIEEATYPRRMFLPIGVAKAALADEVATADARP